MQDLGQPPKEIVGDMAPGLDFDANGVPKFPGTSEACSIMWSLFLIVIGSFWIIFKESCDSHLYRMANEISLLWNEPTVMCILMENVMIM